MLSPEYSVDLEYHEITLNIREGISDNVSLVIVKREFAREDVWNTEVDSTSTVSLSFSTTVPAQFIQDKPAALPDKYYYGGDPILREEGYSLTNRGSLQGYKNA